MYYFLLHALSHYVAGLGAGVLKIGEYAVDLKREALVGYFVAPHIGHGVGRGRGKDLAAYKEDGADEDDHDHDEDAPFVFGKKRYHVILPPFLNFQF